MTEATKQKARLYLEMRDTDNKLWKRDALGHPLFSTKPVDDEQHGRRAIAEMIAVAKREQLLCEIRLITEDGHVLVRETVK